MATKVSVTYVPSDLVEDGFIESQQEAAVWFAKHENELRELLQDTARTFFVERLKRAAFRRP